MEKEVKAFSFSGFILVSSACRTSLKLKLKNDASSNISLLQKWDIKQNYGEFQ